MTRHRFFRRTAGLFAALVLASCFGDSTGPGRVRQARLSLAPTFDPQAALLVPFDQVHIRLVRPADSSVALDTTIAFPATLDTLVLDLQVAIDAASEQFLLTMELIDGTTQTVQFRLGPVTVTATTAPGGPPAPLPPPTYVGVGSNAAGVRFVSTPGSVFFGDTVTFVAEAFDSANAAIPNTPIKWLSSDTTRAVPVAAVPGRVAGGIARGTAQITAQLFTSQAVNTTILVQPKPQTLLVQAGDNQAAPAGNLLPTPLTARVNAADGLGVQGVIVSFAVTAGGGTLSQPADITDANGDASVTLTLGGTLGPQTVTASSASLTPANITFTSNAIVGPPKMVGFTVQPSNGAAFTALTPAIQVAAQDSLGFTVTAFTGNITIAIGANPGSATLGGTVTRAAVAGIATFNDLTVNAQGTGYTLAATATGLTAATSATFDIAGGVPAALVITQQPQATTGGATITPPVTVEVRDVFNNLVTTAGGTVSVAIGVNPNSGALGGTLGVPVTGGVATFSDLSIDSAGTGYTLAFSSAGLPNVASASFNITTGTATVLQFGVQPPNSAIFQSPFIVDVKALDAGGNLVTSYTGPVTLDIGANPNAGVLFGTTTVNAVGGIATFSGVSIDNLGTGYTLTANATGLTGVQSNPMDIVAPANANVWTNLAGGSWSNPANWSLGTVPTATDTVMIRQSGTYIVNLDVSATLARLDVGAPTGTQELRINGATLTMAGNGSFSANTRLNLENGLLTGPGTIDVFGFVDWSGGDIAGGAGLLRVLPGAVMFLFGSSRTFTDYAIEVGGTVSWSGTQTINAGQGALIRVTNGGVISIQDNPTFVSNQGGTPARFDVQAGGAVSRFSNAGVATLAGFDLAGTLNVTTGTLRLQGGGTSTGSYNVSPSATLEFAGGTHTLGGPASVNASGNVVVSAGTLDAAGTWAVTGLINVTGGTANFHGATMTADAVELSGGFLGGVAGGLLQVTSSFLWSGGSIQGGGGMLRALPGSTTSFSGATSRSFTGYTVEIAGSATWTGTAAYNSGQANVLRVLAGGTLDIQGDPSFLSNQGGTATVLQNLGTITRTVSTGTATLNVQVDNDAQLSVSSGVLRLQGGSGAGTADGNYVANLGGILDFIGGVHALGAAGGVSGTGNVLVTAGTVNAAGSWAVSFATQISGGTLNYNGPGGSTGSLSLTSGALGGNAGSVLTASTDFTWSGGSILGAGGTVRVAPAATLSIISAITRNFTTHTLELAGAGTWTGNTGINSGLGAVLRVLSGATLDIQGNPSFVSNQGGTPALLQNQGTITRTVSTGVAIMSVNFDNDAQTTVSTGTLRLANGSGPGTADGAYTIGTGATLEFSAAVHNLGAASTLGGTGTALVSGSATVNASGNWAHGGTTQITGGTLNYSAAGGSTTNLAVSGGNLGGAAGGLLTVSGAFTWSGGNLIGSGGTARSAVGGTLTISGTAGRNFTDYVVEVAGTGTWTGIHTINSGLGAVLRVLSGATLDIQGDPNFAYNQGGTATLLQNQGALTRTVSGGVAILNVNVDNDAQVTVASGTLRLQNGSGPGTAAGVYTANTATTLDFAGGTHALDAAGAVNGPGIVQIAAGTVNAAGTWSVTGTTNTTGGTFDYDGASGSTTTFNLSGGAHGGTGLFQVNTAMTWSGGNLTGTGGTTRVLSSGSLNMTGTAGRNFTDRTLENQGTANWSGSFSLNSGQGAVMRNDVGATFTLSGDANFASNQGGTQARFVNLGTFARNTSVGTAPWNAAFDHLGGTVTISTGILDLSGGGNWSTPGNVLTGAFLDLSGNTFVFDNGVSIIGQGAVRLQGGTLTNSTVADTARFQTLELVGGSLNQVGGVVMQGGPSTLTWSGGTSISGTGTVRVSNTTTMNITGTLGRTFTNGILRNEGTTNWSGNNAINTGIGAIWRNVVGGSLIISGNGTLAHNQGGAATFDNLGQVTRNGAGTATIDAAFNHSGAAGVTVSTGVLSLTGGGTVTQAITVAGGAFLDYTTGAFTLNNGANHTGAGFVRVVGANIANSTALDTARFQNLQFSSGNLNHIGGIVVFGGTATMNWDGGAILGSGTLRLGNTPAILNIIGTNNRTFTNGTILNQGNIVWSGTHAISTGLGATIQNTNGATFTLSGDGALTSNQGAPAATFNNVGVFTRSTSAGTATWSAAFNHSATGTMAINTGTMALSGGGLMSAPITIAGGSFLDYASNVFTLNNGLNVTGAGTARLQSGGITTSTALDTARFTNLQLNSGNLTQPGGVVISGLLDWAGGTSIQGTGMTRLATGSLTLTGTVNRTLINGTLENRGSTSDWSGTFLINTGLNGVFRNAAGGILNVSAANPTISLNQGGAALFDNLGTVNRTVGAAGFVLNAPIGGGGGWNVLSGNLDLQGGGTVTGATTVAAGTFLLFNGNTFTYSAASSINGAGTMNVNAGTVNANGPITIGTLNVNGGSLVMGGTNTVAVTGNFATTGAGTLSQTGATSVLDINGNASFGGGTSVLSAGTMLLGGNFTQAGVPTAFPASGTHHATLDGAVLQTINFANPGNAQSRFHRLQTAAGRNVTIQSNVVVGDSLHMLAVSGNYDLLASGVTQRLTVNGIVRLEQSTGSPRIQVPALELSVTPQIIAGAGRGLAADTTVFLNTIPAIPTAGGIAYNHIRINTTGIINAGPTITTTGDVSITGGTLDLAGQRLTVGGNFSTLGGAGLLRQTVAADSLIILGNAVFAGNSTLGQMTAGAIEFRGNFAQGGGSTQAFAPTVAHRTHFTGTTAQTITFNNPAGSFFHRLWLNKPAGAGRVVNMLSDVDVNDTLRLMNASELVSGGGTGNQSITAQTVRMSATSIQALVRPRLMIVNASIVGDSVNPGAITFRPDTLALTGIAAYTLPMANYIALQNVRLSTTGITSTFGSDPIAGDVRITSGRFRHQSGSITIGGVLQTTGAGSLEMSAGGPTLIVQDSAIFGGGSTAGFLTSGTLQLKGHFVNTTAAGFQAAGTHITQFNGPVGLGTAVQNVTMTNPGTGAGQSRFNRLALTRSNVGTALDVQINLQTSVQAGNVVDSSQGQADSILGTGTVTLTTDSMQLTNTVFNNARMVVTNTGFGHQGNTVRFENMNPATVDYIAFTRTNTSISLSFSNFNFATARTTGRYFSVTTVGGVATGAFVSFATSLPGVANMVFANSDYFRGGTQMPTINWNGTNNP